MKMLNKDVCKKCFAASDRKHRLDEWETTTAKIDRLEESHTRTYCKFTKSGVISLLGKPPRRCPYLLEHTVTMQDMTEEIAKLTRLEEARRIFNLEQEQHPAHDYKFFEQYLRAREE